MKLQSLQSKKQLSNPRKIDYNLVDAQQARSVLDRIVGYELSPVLWRKSRSRSYQQVECNQFLLD